MSIKVLPVSIFEFPRSVAVCSLAIGRADVEGKELGTELLQRIPVPDDLLQATAARQFEYRCGRLAALLALEKIQAQIQAPSRGPQGEPQWPEGFCGSITHTNGFVAAAASNSPDIQAIGIDAEALLPFDRICTIAEAAMSKGESQRLGREFQTSDKKAEIHLGVISAKESILKCLYAQWQLLDFIDLELLDITPDTGDSFRLVFQCNKHGRPRILSWFTYDHERVYSCSTLPRIS